ncbi:restriction endonuclease subunit S [Enterobacter sp. EC_62]|uniref:restriction endonuclease subunit S n=1 Tax=Enterobacter sp. EC_62 TaxID=2584091 RepID=UPI001C703CC3|nr:restriction endonuclease subunit S [Enterobacter sp. EC_62]EHI9997916.1 restriction endonuclease subunit S [Salmonella enterica]MBW9389615.1 restriction endonuclease subunit S [Enterobacter sp. EC_62]
MSEFSYLEKLLDGVEVKWLPLGHIAAIKTGQSVNKNMISKNPGVYPVINSGREPLGFINTWNTDNDPIGITTRGAGVGSVIWQEGKYFRGNLNYSITIDKKSHINIRYMYHALLHMKNDIHELCTFDGIPALNAGSLKKLLIPIPCPNNPEKSLAIQAEIVRILDKFTALTAELTAELTERKKQYNYYRDQLLSFEEGEVEWKTLGEIAKIQRGASPRPIAQYMTDADDGIPWIKIGDTSPDSKYINGTAQKVTPDGAKKSRILNPGDFVISNSMSFGRPYILSITGAIHDGWASISDFSERLDSDYLYHYLSSQRVKNYWGSKINSGSVSNLNADIIKTLPLPLPDIQKQKWIATLLDKFDTLTSSISEGIPREIELRQKQYEYYRDLLFSFPKSEAASN